MRFFSTQERYSLYYRASMLVMLVHLHTVYTMTSKPHYKATCCLDALIYLSELLNPGGLQTVPAFKIKANFEEWKSRSPF